MTEFERCGLENPRRFFSLASVNCAFLLQSQ